MSGPGRGEHYLGHVHNFRGFAIVLIIFTHCISVFDWSDSPVLAEVLKRAVANGTILFLFIAGYLFQHLSDRYRVGDYLSKKARFVVLPYLIVSLPALILFTVIMRRPDMPLGFYDKTVFEQVAFFLMTGSHLAPFWFIPTIIIFYLASPALYWLDRQPWFYWLLPLLVSIPVFVSRGHLNPLQSFVHFLPVWILGMACSRHQAVATRWLERLWWPLVAVMVILFGLEMALTRGTHTWYSSMGKIVLTLVLFEAFRHGGRRFDNVFALAGTLSFGLFFLHSYVVSAGKVVLDKLIGAPPSGNLFLFILSGLIAVLLSTLVVQVLRRLLGRNSRSLIGV